MALAATEFIRPEAAMRRGWSRRDVIRQCLAAGVLIVPAGWDEADVLHAWFDAQARREPTPHVEMSCS